MSLINREALYEKVCGLEAQALSYIEKIIHDEDKVEEWKIWSAILTERTAFKHDIFDAPEVKPECKTGRWEIYVISMLDGEGCKCSECGFEGVPYWDFCPNCGARMEDGE